MKQISAKIIYFYKNQDYLVFWSSALALFFSLIVIVFFLINQPSLPNQLPLFYSLPWGNRQLINYSQFMILPTMILLITLTNLTIGWYLHSSQLILKRTLAFSSLFIAMLLLITAVKIIYIFI